MAEPYAPAICTIKWAVERNGENGYVIETWGERYGSLKFGPMPRDFIGPFIDERKEIISDIAKKVQDHVRP